MLRASTMQKEYVLVSFCGAQLWLIFFVNKRSVVTTDMKCKNKTSLKSSLIYHICNNFGFGSLPNSLRFKWNRAGVIHQVSSSYFAWWRHQMETFSALLALCAGNSPVTGEFPSQRQVTRSFDVFFDLHPKKRLSKQSWGWWFETPSLSLWRHCNVSYPWWKTIFCNTGCASGDTGRNNKSSRSYYSTVYIETNLLRTPSLLNCSMQYIQLSMFMYLALQHIVGAIIRNHTLQSLVCQYTTGYVAVSHGFAKKNCAMIG